MSVHLDALADEVFNAASAQALPACQVDRFPFGEVRHSPAYPDLTFLNGLVDLQAPGWSVGDVERVIAGHFPDRANVRVCSRDPETISRLGPKLLEAGYQAECRLAMVQVNQPDSDPGSDASLSLVETAAAWEAFDRLVAGETAQHGWSNAIAEQLARLYRQGEEQVQSWLLASLAGDAVGYVGLYQHARVGYLHSLYTRLRSRRQGVGRALVREAAGLAELKGCERLTLQCTRDSFLPGFYHGLGFRTVGEMWIWVKPAVA